MRQHLHSFVLAIALLGGVSLVSAQDARERAPSAATDQKGKLTEEQARAVAQTLQDKPSQTVPPGTKVEVGKKVPDILKLTPMPPEIFAVWPEARDVLYVRLPDRVVLVDPENEFGAQIILDSETTGGPATNNSKQ